MDAHGNERDLPEGVIDADPPGGWESGEVADAETEARNADAIDSPELVESEEPVESDRPGKGVDPDLATGGAGA